MEKYKFAIFDETMSEPVFKDTNISDKIVKTISDALQSINDNTITVSPVMVTKELNVTFSIIENIDGKQYLTHRLIIQPNN
jgi:hypothetical protein